MRKQTIHRIVTLLIALMLGTTAGFFSYTQLLKIPDQVFTDWFYDHTISQSTENNITVIAIDKNSEHTYGIYDTWSRDLLADAVSQLSEDNAAVIGLDIDLSSPSASADEDTALAKACADAGNVVAVASATYATPASDAAASLFNRNLKTSSVSDSQEIDTAENPMHPAAAFTNWEEQKITDIIYPYAELLSSVSIGIGNATQQSADGFVRNAALTIQYEDSSYDSFAVAIYKAFQDHCGNDYNLPNLSHKQLFGFDAFNGHMNCNVISFSDLLSGNYDASLITDNIVLIGEYEEDVKTTLENFIRPNQTQQEVLLQVAIIQSLLNQDTTTTVPVWVQSILVTILISAFYLVIASRKFWVTLLSSFFLGQVTVGIGFLFNLAGYRFQLLVPSIFLIFTFIISLMQRNIVSILERKLMERTLKMYVEPQIVEQLSEKSPHELASLSERRHVAVLFVDIRGFTTLSELLEPEQVVEILNEYLTLVADAIQHWGGTLDKFIGDAAMAIFNAPKNQKDYIFSAICTAYEISKKADYLREKYEARYGKPVTFGIGVNCGEAIVGNIGSLNRMDYTAIGDTVNTASRLEANAKAGQILISESVYEVIHDRIDATYIGALTLKGKTKTVETYQVDRITSLPESAFHRKGHK